MNTAPVVRAVTVQCSPATAYEVFVERIAHWWPLATHGLFGSAATVAFEGDLLVERALDGRSAVWGRILEASPPSLLRMTWHPGRSADEAAGEVTVHFRAEGDGTRVELVHDGWDRLADPASRRRPYVGPNAWGYVLEHLTHLVELADDTIAQALRDASDAFFDEALRGGFGAPRDGGWSAPQVIAHVALNDLALAAVARDLIHERPTRFENVTCQDRGILDAWVGQDDAETLVRRGRQAAATAQALVARLDPDQLATPVPCRLLHDGEVVLDEAMPWGQVALHVQAGRHLPAHTRQLADLRSDR